MSIPPSHIVPAPAGPLPLPDPDGAPLAALRAALAHYRAVADPAALEQALAAGRPLLAATPATATPDVPALRAFAAACPEFDELITAAAREAARAVAAGHAELWGRLGLHGAPPAWDAAEHDAARMVFACACSPAVAADPDWVPAGLRRLSAARLARLLVAELAGGEAVWLRALGDRYGSLRHRCAPRTAFRSRGLADLMSDDPACRAGVTARVEHWAAAGGDPATLADELEAAVVHARTPSRLA